MPRIQNKEEFRRLFMEYYSPLCNFLLKYTSDEKLVEDTVQDMFLRLWNTRKESELAGNPKAYLFQAVKNRLFEHFRSQKAYDRHIQQYSENLKLSADEDELADRLVKLERINQSLRHLTPKCREVFILHKFNGLTYAEIAEALGISQKTVEGHMLKAIKHLRELLAQ